MDPRTRVWLKLGKVLHLESHPVALLCIAYLAPGFAIGFLWLWLGLGMPMVFTAVTVAVIYVFSVAYITIGTRRDWKRAQARSGITGSEDDDLAGHAPSKPHRRFLSFASRHWLLLLTVVVVVIWLVANVK